MIRQYLPILGWARDYDRRALIGDSIAAVIVTVMLIPQSLAYALLAGVPPEMGLYASILPLVAYAFFGTSRTLSVGPVAVVSLLTATAIGDLAAAGTEQYLEAAIVLALLSGIMLTVMGLLRFGFLANFLSHPVVVGFISASGIIIALSQLRHILGIEARGDTLPDLLHSLYLHLDQIHWPTTLVGVGAVALLFGMRQFIKPMLQALGASPLVADSLAKTGPVLVIVLTTLLAWGLSLGEAGVALVGNVPQGLPQLMMPKFSGELWHSLLGAAALISIIGYVESISVGRTLAAKRRQRVDANQELIGLGSANIASAFSGGFPVTGGFSRSVVNFDAGAITQAASIFTAIGIALAALFLTPTLAYLPKATLAAAIIVAVLALVDFSILGKTWRFCKSDFSAVSTTIGVTLLFGVELGVLGGVVASLALHLYKTSKPHIAIVGEIPGTEHFRNVKRHNVITYPHIISMRVDESLYFANASFLEDEVYRLVSENDAVKHIILMGTAINEIDTSALEALEAINTRLNELGIQLHFSEIKGPVMDSLKRSDFFQHFHGNVYLSQHQAIADLKDKEA